MRTTAEETEQTNQLILETAIRIFSKKSYESVNMQDIAEAAGISRGPLYYRYKTKADLFRAAYCADSERQVEDYRAIFSQDKPILERIRDDMVYCTSGMEMEDYAAMNKSVLREQFPDLIEKTHDYEKQVFSIKEEAVSEAIAAGELRADADAREIVNLMFIFAEGLFSVANRHFRLSRKEIDARIDDLMDILEKRYRAG